ncbi:effector-associated constant component EACC1 [Streptomyces tunisiensis]|uniref:effector-associated constant component EACC1 n=1 Tax=Streptomyces tunisiensis TaxID=948699 RepID=UPI0039893989
MRVDSSAGELRSLQGWLRADPETRRSVTAQVRGGVPGPGEMGAALDVLQLVTGNGWSAASFVLAVAADTSAVAAGGDPPRGHGHRSH